MPINDSPPGMIEAKTIFHREHGAATLNAVDASHALSNFPNGWRDKPWTADEVDALDESLGDDRSLLPR